MKRKLLCILLSALMIASTLILSSCSTASSKDPENEEEKEKSVRTPATITIWVPTDKNTTSEAISLVQAELNKITQNTYSTAIELHAIPSDQYEEKLNARMEEISEIKKQTDAEKKARRKAEREARKNGETLAPVTTTAVEEVAPTVNEYGMTFPSVSSTQLDLFLIRGFDDFHQRVEDMVLSPLDDSLNGGSKLIKSYVYPTFLTYGSMYSTTYAIPNSHPIGEYTYLLINKELCDSYYYDHESMETLLSCKDFIFDVAKNSNVTPLLSEQDTTGIHYWSEDGKFSVAASLVSDDQEATSKLNIRNVFALKQFVNTTAMMKELKEANAIGTNPNEKNFGVGVIKGDAKSIKEYEDNYYIKVLQKPRLSTEDGFQALFAVSNYTKDVNRTMEILTLINTDSKFRTIFQYGVEGVHWKTEQNEDGETVLKKLNNDYIMKLVETGNEFITYPGEGIPMSYWDDYVQQNLDSLLDPFARFVGYIDEKNQKYFDALKTYSESVYSRVSKMTAEEFLASVEAINEEILDADPYLDIVAEAPEGYESLTQKYSDFHGEFIKGNE